MTNIIFGVDIIDRVKLHHYNTIRMSVKRTKQTNYDTIILFQGKLQKFQFM